MLAVEVGSKISTTTKVVIGVAVVTGVTATAVTYTHWDQANTLAVQEKAKNKYCTSYPTDLVCTGKNPVYYLVTYQSSYATRSQCNLMMTQVGSKQLLGPINSIDWSLRLKGMPNYVETGYGGSAHAYINHGNKLQSWVIGTSGAICMNPTLYTTQINSVVRLDGKPDVGGSKDWQDWPQAKRDIAVGMLTPSDWSGFIESMPPGLALQPGDTLDIPTIVLPGRPLDNPDTPEDDRLPQVIPGPWTIPTPYPDLVPTPSPSPDPDPEPSPSPSPSTSPSSSPSPSPSPTPPPPINNTDAPPSDAPPPANNNDSPPADAPPSDGSSNPPDSAPFDFDDDGTDDDSDPAPQDPDIPTASSDAPPESSPEPSPNQNGEQETWNPPLGSIPANWGDREVTKKGIGQRWIDPNNPGANGVRIDQGNPNNSQPTQQVDHVVVRKDGKVIGRDGQPISGKIKDNPTTAHIPLQEWLTWSKWYAP